MNSCNLHKINTIFGGILPPPQLLHALEGGNPRLLPSKFMSTALKTVDTSNLTDRKTLKKIDEGKEISYRTWNKLRNASELRKSIERLESIPYFEAGPSTMAWYGFAMDYHNRLPLQNTLKFIREGVQQEIRIQTGKLCLADAIEDLSIAATEKHYISEKVSHWLHRFQSHDNERKQDRSSSDILNSDMGRLFMTELVVSSTIAFLLRYELDLETEYCPDQAHSKNRYISMYFNDDNENKSAMELLVSFWQQELSELSKEKITRRGIADFMPGESDIDEKARQLRAWTSGENMPKDENLIRFLLSAFGWLSERESAIDIQAETTARYLYRVARIYMTLDALKRDLTSTLFKSNDFSACYKRQASLI